MMPPLLRRVVSLTVAHPDLSAIVTLAVALVTGLALLPLSDGFGLRALAVVGILVSTVCLTLVARAAAGGVWSVPFVCLLVLVIFHLGALPEFLYRDTASLSYI